MLHNLLHNQVLHEQVVLLTVRYEDRPRFRAGSGERMEVETSVMASIGFAALRLHGRTRHSPGAQPLPLSGTGFHADAYHLLLSRETVIASKRLGMAPWRENLFVFR